MVLAIAGVGWALYRDWQQHAQRRQAAALIEEGQALAERLHDTPGIVAHDVDFGAARDQLQAARTAYGRGEFGDSRRAGTQARNVLLAILDTLTRRGGTGEGQFISVHGEVEIRRGDRGDWQLARGRVTLSSGDYVRTGSGGSAEILFGDGTLYTVRPNTSFVVSRTARGEGGDGDPQTISMAYGWVDLNTASRPSRVETPSAEARVAEESEAFVAFDRERQRGRFGAFRGTVDVGAGEVQRRVGAFEQVVQENGELGRPRSLPARPEPLSPADNVLVDPGREPELVLAWRPVSGVSRYALQVSRNHLFVDNLIEDEERRKTEATLGLRGDGSFLWRVAARATDGTLGPWSAPRRFRVAAAAVDGFNGGDRVPPEISLEDVTAYGNIFIVGGRTEPGARVEIGGEPVKVAADGSFIKTIQLNRAGWSFIEIRARDAWGNETTRRHRVFVDTP